MACTTENIYYMARYRKRKISLYAVLPHLLIESGNGTFLMISSSLYNCDDCNRFVVIIK